MIVLFRKDVVLMIMNSTPIIDTVIEENLMTKPEEEKDRGWKVIVWNDDYHSFEYVIEVFMKHFGLSEKIAVKKTFEVHNIGKSTLDRGSKSNMEFHSMIMENTYELTSTVEKISD